RLPTERDRDVAWWSRRRHWPPDLCRVGRQGWQQRDHIRLMMQIPRFIRRRLTLPRDDAGVPSERGDTLIEVLVAIAVISIAGVALLGSLLTSASASVTHRNVTNLDGILRSFAESARYQIQTQPADGSVGPQFRPCGVGSAPPQYNLASDPYPNS